MNSLDSIALSILKRAGATEGEAFVEPGAGGNLGLNRFVGGATEALWIATYTMFIIWLLALILCPLSAVVGGREKYAIPKALRNFARASRDGFLILLGNVAITQSGFGTTPAVVVLTWIIFGLLVLWVVMQIVGAYVPWSWWINSLVFLPIAVLAIINFALAFRAAPSER